MYIHSTCILFDVLAIKHIYRLNGIISYRSLCLTFNGTSYFIWSDILLLNLRRHVGLDRVFFMNTKTLIFLLYFREILLSCSFYKIETFYFNRFYPSKCIIDRYKKKKKERWTVGYQIPVNANLQEIEQFCFFSKSKTPDSSKWQWFILSL